MRMFRKCSHHHMCYWMHSCINKRSLPGYFLIIFWNDVKAISTHFWGVCAWECFCMRLAFESWMQWSRLPSPMQVTSAGEHQPVHWGPKQSKRQREVGITIPLPDCLSWGRRVFSSLGRGTTSSALLVLGSLDLDWPVTPAFLRLQLADGRLWDLPSSIIMWTISS